MAAPSPGFVIRGARVLDEGGGFTNPLDVRVQDGRIAAMGQNLSTPGDCREADGQGSWLLPGVIDCHVHLPSAPTEAGRALRQALESGVTLLRDAGGARAQMRDGIAAGSIVGPRLQVALAALGPEGGPGGDELRRLFARDPGAPTPATLDLRTASGMRRAVSALLAAGADWVKLMAGGGLFTEADPLDAQLGGGPIRAAVESAAAAGRGAMVHALGGVVLSQAAEAGARSVEHGVYLTERDANVLARRHCALVPTLVVYQRMAEAAEAGEIEGVGARRALSIRPHLGEAVRIAHAAGVPIALGSDADEVEWHGTSLRELYYLREAGLTPEEALLAGTARGAELCGVGDQLGRLVPGNWFDAVVLDADPGDLSCFLDRHAVTGVFKAGVSVLPHARLASFS